MYKAYFKLIRTWHPDKAKTYASEVPEALTAFTGAFMEVKVRLVDVA